MNTIFLSDSSCSNVKSGDVFAPQSIRLRENISYSSKTGIITINDSGQYLIIWCVSAKSSGDYDGIINISFNQITPSSVVISTSSSNSTASAGECNNLPGCALFTATAGSTYAFYNNSKATLTISPNSLPETNIVILKVN